MVRLRRYRRDVRGQAVVEFALVVPLFVLLLVGIVQFARAWNAYQVLTYAAREAARQGALPNRAINSDSLRRMVRRHVAAAALDSTKLEITLVNVDTVAGLPTTVTLRYPYKFTVFGGARGATVTLVSSMVMRNE